MDGPSVAAMTTIAVLGTGAMGAPMAGRLLRAGYPMTVWNRTAARTDALAAAGARRARSPAEAVADADVVITMLSDGPAVRAVLAAAAPALRPGACVVEMSTIGPAAVAEVAALLPDQVDLVDAPVAGGVSAAAEGRLTILAGGPAQAVDRVAPILEQLGTVRRCGAQGSGAALKLVLNTALGTAIAALADTLAVADALGVDRDEALTVLGDGPLRGAVARVRAGGAFAVALAAKDLALALDRTATATPVAAAAAAVLRDHPDQHADLTKVVLP